MVTKRFNCGKNIQDIHTFTLSVVRLQVWSSRGAGGAPRGGEESPGPAAVQCSGEQCSQTTRAAQAAGAEAGTGLSSDAVPVCSHRESSERKLLPATAAAR